MGENTFKNAYRLCLRDQQFKAHSVFLVGGGGKLCVFSPGGGHEPNSCVKNDGDKV